MGRPRPPPAFATRISTRPHSWTTRATIASTSLMVTDINLDTYGSAARRLNLGDRAVGGHVLGPGLEFLIRAWVQVGHRDLRTQSGEPLRVCTPETTRRARDDRHRAVQLAHHQPPIWFTM